MTKTMFKRQFKRLIRNFKTQKGRVFTCNQIYCFIGFDAKEDYSKFINDFVYDSSSHNVLNKDYWHCTNNKEISPAYAIRTLLLCSFYEEVIRSNQYLKWN